MKIYIQKVEDGMHLQANKGNTSYGQYYNTTDKNHLLYVSSEAQAVNRFKEFYKLNSKKTRIITIREVQDGILFNTKYKNNYYGQYFHTTNENSYLYVSSIEHAKQRFKKMLKEMIKKNNNLKVLFKSSEN